MLTRRSFLRLLAGGLLAAAISPQLTLAGDQRPQTAKSSGDVIITDQNRVYHEGWILTVKDKERVKEVASKSGFEILPKIDLPGADLKDIIVADEEDCAATCMSDPRCLSFTYALPTHPIASKQNRCWLKNSKTLGRNPDANYISGVRL